MTDVSFTWSLAVILRESLRNRTKTSRTTSHRWTTTHNNNLKIYPKPWHNNNKKQPNSRIAAKYSISRVGNKDRSQHRLRQSIKQTKNWRTWSSQPIKHQNKTKQIITMSKAKAVDPLRDFLDAVVTRIENLEAHVGISGAAVAASSSSGGGAAAALSSSSTHSTALQKSPSSRHIAGAGM